RSSVPPFSNRAVRTEERVRSSVARLQHASRISRRLTPPVRLMQSLRGEAVNRRLPVGLARLQDDRGEVGMVHAVRIVLRFQAEALLFVVSDAALALEFPIEEVAG